MNACYISAPKLGHRWVETVSTLVGKQAQRINLGLHPDERQTLVKGHCRLQAHMPTAKQTEWPERKLQS